MRLIRRVGLGRKSAACFNSARLERASIQTLSVSTVSTSTFGGKGGSSLNGLDGSFDVFMKSGFVDMAEPYVDGIDM